MRKVKWYVPCLRQHREKFVELPFIEEFTQAKDIGNLENQYHKLLNVDWCKHLDEEVFNNVYLFWPQVLKYKDAGEKFVFKELADFALRVLSLPSSNACVERIFSVMNCVKTKSRNKMQEEMLAAILRIRTYSSNANICCYNFKPSKAMFKKFTSDIYTKMETDTRQETQHEEDVFEYVEEFDVPCLNVL
ncbi:hypothetical protein TcasGA2_TC016407 [Tribolium castaneum]|uniref:HAT C-terminal dimerisation domain-containing protein n=1 Tax=Tribolium castaneum TaxID=7070 RepID=D7EIX2_TRICA|nr:hypothetical protein TcasGA2_TC016407 [Tribolium castaneum]